MEDPTAWLPDRICLEDFDGDFPSYLEALYQEYYFDWVENPPPEFQGKRVGLKRHPQLNEKDATFWHFITEGEVECERLTNLRRCELIRWPRRLIEAVGTDQVCCWAQPRRGRKGESRLAITTTDFSYLLVLADRVDYVLPWTAFPVEHDFQRSKLRKEWLEVTGQR